MLPDPCQGLFRYRLIVLLQKLAVFVEGPLRDLRQGLFEVLARLLVTDGLERAGSAFAFRIRSTALPSKAWYLRACSIAPDGCRRFRSALSSEDIPGMEAAVSRMLFDEPLQELLAASPRAMKASLTGSRP